MLIGKPVEIEKFKEDFPAAEGDIELIYGRIGQGKSTEAVRRMYESLTQGRAVYSNVALDLENERFDQRDSFELTFWRTLFGKRRFYVFQKANYHYFNPTTGVCDGEQVFNPERRGAEIDWLNTLTDCEIYYDEGQWLLDSYEKTDVSVDKRKLITETRHNNRKIVIIAQRTQSVHVNARGNVNIFYKCIKQRFLFFWTVLTIVEYQDMKGQDVDESADPVSVQKFWTSSRYWRLFNTHFLRAGKPKSQEVHYEAYDLRIEHKIILLFYHIGRKVPFLKRYIKPLF